MAIEGLDLDLWIAESDNGSVVFEEKPTDLDIEAQRDGLTGEIRLFAVTARVLSDTLLKIYPDPDEEGDE